MLNNFIYAQTKDLFLNALNAGNVLDEAIVFIEDTKEIWNRGHYFGGDSGIDPEVLSGIETAIATLQSDKADKSELANYAKKNELPSLDGYLTKTVADGLYATIAQYNALNQTVGNIQTELSNKATKDELSTGLAGKLDNSAASGFVSTTRKVNGVALDQDITITATDPNAATKTELNSINTDLQTFKSNVATTYATDQDVANAVAALVGSVPETLNTLDELAAALGDDPNFATTVATNIGKKADQSALNQTNADLANVDAKFANYLNLTGGQLQGSSRIGYSGDELFIGNEENNGWVRFQDICSQKQDDNGDSPWEILETGESRFKKLQLNNGGYLDHDDAGDLIIGNTEGEIYFDQPFGTFGIYCDSQPVRIGKGEDTVAFFTGDIIGSDYHGDDAAEAGYEGEQWRIGFEGDADFRNLDLRGDANVRGDVNVTGEGSFDTVFVDSTLTARNIIGDVTGNVSGSAGSATYASYLGNSSSNYTKSSLDTALGNKVDKVSGKGLSTNDFTTALKNKLDALPTTFAPTNAEANVQADWNVTDSSSDAFIKNKPTIPTVPNLSGGSAAETGKYVSGVTVSGHTVTVTKGTLPTIPSVGNGTVTIKQNGTTKGTFTMNQSGNTTIELTDTDTDTNTHYTTRIYAGASGTAANAAASNPYVKITDDNVYRNQIQIKGGGATTVSSDANGVITISSTDTNTTYSLSSLGIGNVKNYDQSKAIKSITRSGTTFTYTCLDGTTGTFTQQDNNTTYNLGSFGITATAAELNYTDGVTSNIQTQLNDKQATISDLSTIRSNASNGATAYSWGNHANAGYITEGFREYDCVGIPSDYITDHTAALFATLKDYIHTSKAVFINNVSASSIDDGKNYRIVFTKDGVPFVNVPWTDTNTDENTGYVSSSANSDYPILFKPSTGSTTKAAKSAFNTYVTLNPSTRTLQVGSASSILYYGKVQAGGGFFQTSDETLKNFKESIPIDFEALKSIPKKYFTWKDGDNKIEIGTGAQSLQKVYPELVTDNNGVLTVAYDKLSVIALAAIDKLYDEKKALEERVERLEKFIEKLV